MIANVTRTRSLVAIAALGATVVGALALTGFAISYDEYSIALGGAGSVVIGALLLRSRPGNRIGLILLAFGVVSVLTDFSLGAVTSGARSRLIVLIGASAFVFVGTLGNALFLTFPTGATRGRWRWLLRVVVGVGVTGVVVGLAWALAHETPVVVDALAEESAMRGTSNPAEAFAAVTFVLTVPALASLIGRYRAAVEVERLQIRWLLFAGITLVTLTVGLNITGDFSSPLVTAASSTSFLFLPLAIGIAVTRYRLYEIDRIISRTVSYGLLAIIVGVVFALPVVIVPSLFASSSDIVIAASTLGSAALFNPLRRRIQRTVDSRFNRARYDADEAATAFSTTIRSSSDLDRTLTELASVVDRTVQPARSSVWLREPLQSAEM